MKLLNQSVKYLSASLLIIIGAWTVIIYFSLLDEIKESIDEGLENSKRQIIYNLKSDSTVLKKYSFAEGNFSIREISQPEALSFKDLYIDSMIYMQDADDKEMELESVRMLVTAFESNGSYFELSIVNSMVEEDDFIEELFIKAIWLYLVLIAGIIIINNFVLQRLWKPFYDLLNQLKNYRIGKSIQVPAIKTNTKEFADLQQAVNTLIRHNLETFSQQKQFIGNASHELQTPLAIATTKLELLLEKGELENEQAKKISEVLNILERMVRLNKSLLLLTKIENKQFSGDQPVHINQVVKQTINELDDITEFRNVQIALTETVRLEVRIDNSLADIMVSNLVRNAIFHNIPGGKVHIEILKDRIRICNSGKDIPLDEEKIFTRFYKPDDGQSGSGLGLAIVKAICGFYGFSVSYQFENNLHCFDLRFS